MPAKLEPHAPQARCAACGSPKIVSVCHHCGCPACKDDSNATVDLSGRPLSYEFAQLGVVQKGPHHCDKCSHLVKGRVWTLVLVGSTVALIGVVIAIGNIIPGLILIVLGSAFAIGMQFADRRRVAAALGARPPLPVIAKIESVHITETVHGSLGLDWEGVYRTAVDPLEGEIEISMTLGRPDRDRLRRYIKKYRLADKGNIEFSAGFAAMRGQASLEYVSQDLDLIDFSAERTVIPIRGMISALPYFNSAYSRSAAPWKLRVCYHLHGDRRVESIPVWLTPTLVPESDQRTLALDLQWTDGGMEDAPLAIDRVETLKLMVPLPWGPVEAVERGRALIGKEELPENKNEVMRTISWTQIVLSEEEKASKRLTLRIRFENQIELADTLRGELSVTFRNTLSGLEGVDIYHPLGERRRNSHKREVKTKVSAAFTLSLFGIRYQDLRVVPDRKQDIQRSDTDDFPGVIPDHETVIALTNAISDQGYYVKRVIENPPRSGARASVMNRYWDIAGRRYDGVYPVDFHVVLTGEELHKGDVRASTGNTRTRITVQGAYVSSSMEQRIVAEWEKLHGLAVETLRELGTENWKSPDM
jgi:hypothetical protein